MAEITVTTAFMGVPSSTSKTNLIASLEQVITDLESAQEGGAFSELVLAQLSAMTVDLAETIASNMTDYSGAGS